MTKKTTEEIYEIIVGYSDGAITDWHNAESLLFEYIACWFWKEIGKLGQPNKELTITKVEMSEIEKILKNKSIRGDNNKTYMDFFDANKCYQFNSFENFLGAIKEIGKDNRTNHQIYFIRLANNSLAYTTPIMHYTELISSRYCQFWYRF